MQESKEYDVVVVGLGPTGATLANLLAQCGINTLVLEREAAIYDLPRAVHFDDEVMRVFQTVGIAENLSNKVRVNPGMRFVDSNENILLDWPRPQQVSDQGWYASYRLHQPDLERLLRAKLDTYSHCNVLTGARLIHTTSAKDAMASDAVQFSYEHNGVTHESKARFMVGCDGANSTVRKLIPGEMIDLGFRERWLVVDMKLNQKMPQLGDHTIQYCDSEQPMTYCRNPGMRRRWEMALPDELSDQDAIDEKRIWGKLAQWLTPSVATMERKAIYTFRSAVAKRWRHGRLFIAGDAAHLTPPFMGQGMCAGIRDAANIAWKLAAVVNQSMPHSLLDTYQPERDPHVRQYINTAVKLGELINSVNPDTAGELSSSAGKSVMASLSPTIGIAFTEWLNLSASADCGRLFTQPRLSNNKLLDDAVGYQYALITEEIVQSLPIPVIPASQHSELAEALNHFSALAVLIRPDRYIAAVAHDNAELAELIRAINRISPQPHPCKGPDTDSAHPRHPV